MNDFRRDWNESFGDSVPLSWRLIENFPDRCLRIHSLPTSKKRIDDETEWEILLDRTNSVVDEVVGSENPFWLLSSSPTPTFLQRNITRRFWYVAERAYALKPVWNCVDPTEASEDQGNWTVSARQISWRRGQFDKAFRLIATENIHCIGWFSPSRGRLVMPYYGGMDVFVRDTNEQKMLSRKFGDWIPKDEV